MLCTAKSTDHYRLQITALYAKTFDLYRLRSRVVSVSSILVTITYFTNIVRVTSLRTCAI
jgi:hypothetical protein